MTLVLVRIDDRLIHGQVTSYWMRHLEANSIIIADDQVAADPFMLDILKLAAPHGVEVVAYGVEQAAQVLSSPDISSKRVMLLVKTPESALRLKKLGVDFEHLNVGGMGNAPGRKTLYRNISASAKELEVLRCLQDMGVTVEFRILSEHRAVSLAELVKE